MSGVRHPDSDTSRPNGMKWGRRFILCWFAIAIPIVLFCAIARPGMYSGRFGMMVFAHPDTLLHTINIQAESEPRWCWVPPPNHRYGRASVELFLAKPQHEMII